MAASAITQPLTVLMARAIMEPGEVGGIVKGLTQTRISELFSGTKATVISVGVSQFVYFYTLYGLMMELRRLGVDPKRPLTHLSLSAVAGIVNVFLTLPLWVVNLKLKLKPPPPFTGLWDGLEHVLRKEGFGALYAGLGWQLALVTNPVVKFGAVNLLRRLIDGEFASSAHGTFLVGVVGGLVATIVTYPLQVLNTLAKGNKPFPDLDKDPKPLRIIQYILKNFGPGYFYNGMKSKLLQSVIAAGFLFLFHDRIARLIFALMGVEAKKTLL